MRTSLLLSVCGLLVCLCTLPAAAAPAALKVADSYVPRVDLGYKLVPVDPGERLGLGLDDALLQNAADYTGLKLDYIFRVRPGMRRRFLLTNVWNEQTMQPGPDYVEELELVPANPRVKDLPGTPYEWENYLGIGYDMGAEGPAGRRDLWRFTLVSLLRSPANDVTVEDTWSSDWPGCGYVYALDLSSDGVVDIACSLFGGASSGGGVALLSVDPAGKLHPFRFDPRPGEADSAFGYFRPLDLKQDGSWQIELCDRPLLFTASGLNAYDLLTYDPARGAWVDGSAAFPAYDKEQVAFYRELTGILTRANDDQSLLQRVGTDACLPVDGLLYRVGYYDPGNNLLQNLLDPQEVVADLLGVAHLARAWEQAAGS